MLSFEANVARSMENNLAATSVEQSAGVVNSNYEAPFTEL